MPKKLGVLRYTSLIGCFLTVFALVFVFANMFTDAKWRDPKTNDILEPESKFSNLFGGSVTLDSLKISAVIAACFAGHMNAPKLYGELRDKSSKNWSYIVFTSFGIVTVCLMIIGICGVITFGPDLMKHNGDLFVGYVAEGNWFCILTLISFSFAVVLKKNLVNKIFGYLARCEFWAKIGLRFWILVG